MEIDPQAARLLRMVGAGARTAAGRIGIAERRRAFDGGSSQNRATWVGIGNRA